MTKKFIEDLILYMNIIGIESEENWFSSAENFEIGENTLVVGVWWAVDDKTGRNFKSIGEIIEFYGLPMLPDNVRR